MSIYRATITEDGEHSRRIVVHWDVNDTARSIAVSPTITAQELNESRLADELATLGFRLLSTESDNLGHGWAIVCRSAGSHKVYNPLDDAWCSHLSGEEKAAIAQRWPDVELAVAC